MRRSRACTSTKVPRVLQQADVLQTILEHLPVNYLLLCSMVSRAFLLFIDENVKTYFNDYLRWWEVYDAAASKCAIIAYNASKEYYEQLYFVSTTRQSQWLTHMHPAVGARVHMRMHLRMKLDHVLLSGKAADIGKVISNGFASFDSLEWEIVDIKGPGAESKVCRGTSCSVVMQLIKYENNNKVVTGQLLKSVVLTFANVPVLLDKLSCRELCVLNSVKRCMHCHQRKGKWHSVDVQHPEHRFLCVLCLEELFIDESKICRTWKIRRSLPAEAQGGVRRNMFWLQKGMYGSVRERVCLLKQDVLRHMGHASTAEVLRRFGGEGKRRRENSVFKHLVISTQWS